MKIVVLECTSGVGKTSGKPYNIVVATVNGKVGKFFSQVPYALGENDVDVDMGVNREMFFTTAFKPLAAKV